MEPTPGLQTTTEGVPCFFCEMTGTLGFSSPGFFLRLLAA